MTDAERKLLHETAERTKQIHDALFQPPADGSPALINRIMAVIVPVERGSWGVKWFIRIVVALGSLILAINAAKSGIASWFGK